jgi:tetratricopeptide (TPR) repeat protein
MQARAEEALGWYQRGDSFENGGYGWTLNAEFRTQQAYLYTIMGEPGKGLEALREVIEYGNPTDSLIIQAGQLAELSTGDVGNLLGVYREGLDKHPDLHLIRSELAKAAYSRGRVEEAEAMWSYEPEENAIGFLMARASFEGFKGDREAVERLYSEAVELVPTVHGNKAGWYIDIARGASAYGMRDLMAELAQKAVESEDATALTWLSAGELANALRDYPLSAQRAEQALTMRGNERSEVLRRAAGIFADADQRDRSVELLELAVERAENDFDRKYIIELMIRIGLVYQHEGALIKGYEHYEALAERRTDIPVIMVDYAIFLYQGGRVDEAFAAMIRAAGLDDRNVAIAQRVAEMYSGVGDSANMQVWYDEAERRRVVNEAVDAAGG